MIYIKIFIKIYNWHFRKLVHKTHEIVKLEKYLISRAKNFLNPSSQQFYKIFKVLQSTNIILRNIKSNIFYLNNYIDWD